MKLVMPYVAFFHPQVTKIYTFRWIVSLAVGIVVVKLEDIIEDDDSKNISSFAVASINVFCRSRMVVYLNFIPP